MWNTNMKSILLYNLIVVASAAYGGKFVFFFLSLSYPSFLQLTGKGV